MKIQIYKYPFIWYKLVSKRYNKYPQQLHFTSMKITREISLFSVLAASKDIYSDQ